MKKIDPYDHYAVCWDTLTLGIFKGVPQGAPYIRERLGCRQVSWRESYVDSAGYKSISGPTN